MTRDPRTLQLILVAHGRWIDKEEAEDIAAQADDLPTERVIEEVMARSRPLTAEERAKLQGARLLTDGTKVEEYPIGTKAYSINGGHWTRVEHGWKWSAPNGGTFPRPGGDAYRYELPDEAGERRS